MSEKLTSQQIQEKAEALSKVHNVNVIPILFEDEATNDQIVGFYKEPSRIIKIRLMDKSVMGGYTAATEVLDLCLLKDESDPRIYSESAADDRYYMGAVSAVFDTIKVATNQLKKK